MALRFASLLLFTILAVGRGVALPPPVSDKCGEKAERRTCGSACAPTCDNPNPGPICVLPCVNGCFCREGYLKAANGQCVRPRDCDSGHRIPQQIPQLNVEAEADVRKNEEPPKCGENEVYSTCGSACTTTCAMPILKPWCTFRCAVGCFCKEGYLKEGGVCIPAPRCKSLQLSNAAVNIPLHKVPLQPHCPSDKEEYKTCGVQSNCFASCKIPKTPEWRQLTLCTPGCACIKPLVRHEDGRCVEKTQCPETTLFDVVAQA